MELDPVFDTLQTAENYHIPQQDQELHGIYSTADLSLNTHFSNDLFLDNSNSQSNALEQFPTFPMSEQYSVESAGNVQTTPASPMGPPARPRKRKAPTLRAQDWEPVRSRILELHITQGLPLPKVKKSIEDEFGFVAELRQYRTRISQWGKDKNVKSHEMSAIVRKRQHRKLLEVNKGELAFEVRGTPVESQKIERWMKRNDVPESLPYAPSPAASTPSAIACRTISECSSPAADLGYSPMASILSPGIAHNLASNSGLSSPALSVSSIVRPQSTSFAGASPAPIFQSLAKNPFPTMSGSEDNMNLAARLTQNRYRQDEEEKLRGELSIEEFIHGIGHSKTLNILHELGNILIEQGRYKSAEKIIRRELETRQTVHGNESLGTISALEFLGRVFGYQGHFARAEEIFRQTSKKRKSLLGMQHPETIKSLNNLGTALLDQGRLVEAGIIQTETLAASTEALGEEHIVTCHSFELSAAVYYRQGRLIEAVEILEKSLSIMRRLFGIESFQTLRGMVNLALVLSKQAAHKKAEEIMGEYLLVSERILESEHPDTLDGLECLTMIYNAQGRLQEGEGIFIRVLEMRKKVLGERHPYTRKSVTTLAWIYEAQGRWAEALELRLQVERMEESLS